MAQTFKSIFGAVAGTILTLIFGWITMKSQLINNKVDYDKYEKDKTEIYQTMKDRDSELENSLLREESERKAEDAKTEQRILREITLTREVLGDIKQDLRDLKRGRLFKFNNSDDNSGIFQLDSAMVSNNIHRSQ